LPNKRGCRRGLVKLDDAVPLDEESPTSRCADPDPTKLMPFCARWIPEPVRRARPRLGVGWTRFPPHKPPRSGCFAQTSEMKVAVSPADAKGCPGAVMDRALVLRPIDYGILREAIVDVAALNRWIAAAQEAACSGSSLETDDADPMRARSSALRSR